MIRAIKFVSIPTRDQDASIAFWTEKLGFRIATDQPFDDTQRWVELRIPGADTRLVLFTPRGHEERIGSLQPISFTADDVERTYEELRAKGVEFVGEPQRADWGTAAIFKDPDGNQFVISTG